MHPGRPRPVEPPSLQAEPAPDKSRGKSAARSPGRRSREAHGPEAPDSATCQRSGTCGDRRARRDHVVHHEGLAAGIGRSGSSGRDTGRDHLVGSGYVQRPLLPSRASLPPVAAGATQEGLDGPAECSGHSICEQACLVEPALTQPRRCQRHGNQHRVLRPQPPGHRCHQGSHARRQRRPAGVLQPVHDPDSRRLEQEGRIRSDQLVGPVRTLGAASLDRQIAEAGVPAARASGTGDRAQPALARPAQGGPTRPEGDRTGDADGRKQRLEQSARCSRAAGGGLQGETPQETPSSARCMEFRTEAGTAMPSHRSRESTPCSSSTLVPSSASAPCCRACAIQRVPPGM